MSFPAHNVARATFTENTDILLFSLKKILFNEASNNNVKHERNDVNISFLIWNKLIYLIIINAIFT